jgi:ABC-type transporter Mla maintaining outer membrane lipid asymmetry ATPase subunit MlaF
MLNEGRVVFDGPAADLDRAQTPFITQFLAPFRKAVAAACSPAAGATRPAQTPPSFGGTS